MAQNLNDPVFWLPPLFLSESDDNLKKNEFALSDSNSGFTSPVDSSMCSTETESDQDDFLTELTRRLTSSIHLSHHLWNPTPNPAFLPPNPKTDTLWKMPESTHCQENVAKITGVEQDTVTGGYIQFRGPPEKPWFNKNHSNKREQNGNGRAGGLSHSAWPSLQQSQSRKLHVPWTNAAPLVTKRECSGTGVFFPRPVATTPTQTHRRKHSALKQRNVSTQRRDTSRAPGTMHNEIRLPQEWTY